MAVLLAVTIPLAPSFPPTPKLPLKPRPLESSVNVNVALLPSGSVHVPVRTLPRTVPVTVLSFGARSSKSRVPVDSRGAEP